jgi:hypothetical protein
MIEALGNTPASIFGWLQQLCIVQIVVISNGISDMQLGTLSKLIQKQI